MLLTASETAQALHTHRRRVYALIREGVLPAVYLGRQVRVAEVALQHFIKTGGQRLPGGWRKRPEPARKNARRPAS